MNKYDVIIIGGACAGLTAGIYTSRRALKTLILTKEVGGQAAITHEIENYPGFLAVGGMDLMTQFQKQAEKAGSNVKIAEVTAINKEDSGFAIESFEGKFFAPALILAFGLSHRRLNVPGEKELTGHGVTYCATCDGPLFKNKIVGVVGGGNSAFDAAEYLSELCQKVYLIHRSEKFRAEEVLVASVKSKKNVEIIANAEVRQIIGEKKLEKISLSNGRELALNGLFIEIGYVPRTELVKDLVALDEQGQIIVDSAGKTNCPGIFAAGDVTNTTFKQVIISAGEGAKAALSAAQYLQKSKGQEVKPDWTRRKR